MNTTYKNILETVTENGRVAANEDGSFDKESMIVEVEFEAQEQGLTTDETAEAVAFALEHSRNS
jgi:hypothetical protein